MAPNTQARKNHDELFPDHVSTLAVTDPELIEIFDNFAFDEVLRHGNLDARTRLMVQLASMIASQALREYRVMLGAAFAVGVTPVEIKEIVYQAVPYVGMPDETVIDGEVVALDESGRPSFNALQNHEPRRTPLLYYVFDVMALAGKDITGEPLTTRLKWLQKVTAELNDPIRQSPALDASLADLMQSVKAHGLEGLVTESSIPGLTRGSFHSRSHARRNLPS